MKKPKKRNLSTKMRIGLIMFALIILVFGEIILTCIKGSLDELRIFCNGHLLWFIIFAIVLSVCPSRPQAGRSRTATICGRLLILRSMLWVPSPELTSMVLPPQSCLPVTSFLKNWNCGVISPMPPGRRIVPP